MERASLVLKELPPLLDLLLAFLLQYVLVCGAAGVVLNSQVFYQLPLVAAILSLGRALKVPNEAISIARYLEEESVYFIDIAFVLLSQLKHVCGQQGKEGNFTAACVS